MQNSKVKISQKGFTLIEMIVTIAVTSLVLVMILGTILFTIKVNLRTRHRTLAYQILEQEVEIVRNTPFENLQNQTAGVFLDTVSEVSNLPSGTGTLTIEDYAGQSTIKQVTADISWLEGDSPKTISLTTLVSRGGIGP